MSPTAAASLALGAILISGAPPTPPISPNLFGLHLQGISVAAPQDLPLTSIRLWDAGVRWDQIETRKGKYDWAALDAAVANAESAGATDILYVFGSTPSWAARDPNLPGLYGDGTTSLPADIEDYLDYVRAVVNRYRGRIGSYQIWNEANTRSFYEGDWVELARLTRRTYDVVKLLDPAAQVIAASSTVIPDDTFQTESFFYRYARELKKLGEPVDAMSVHLYPVDPTGVPADRAESIKAAQKVLDRLGITKPLWDTEVNYGDRRPSAPQIVVPDPQSAAVFVAQTYLDSVRLGIARTYWYGWDSHVLGVDLTDASGVTPAGTAYLTVRSWLSNGHLAGCTELGGLHRCSFQNDLGLPFAVLWTEGEAVNVDPAGLTEVCSIDGSCSTPVDPLVVDGRPLRVR